MQCSGFRIQPYREFRIVDEIVEHAGRTPGISDYTASRISTKTSPEIKQGRKEKGVWSRRSGTLEGNREYMRYQRREVSTNLGGTI